MKQKYRAMISVCSLIVLCSTFVTAQNVTSTVSWPLSGTTIQLPQIAGQLQSDSMRIGKNLMINGYTGPNSSMRIKMNPVWPSNQLGQIDSVYIQCIAKPVPSYALRVDSVVLSLGANSTSDMRANLYYSKDSTFTAKTPVPFLTSVAARVNKPAGTFLSSTTLDTIRFKPNMSLNAGETFYFRIYPWVDSSTSVSGKYVCPQNITIHATAIPIPLYAAATWPLLSSANGNVSGLITASPLVFDGTNLYHYGYNVNGDRWTNHLPSNGAWPAETSPNFARYAQFKISPLTGGTFFADTIRFTQIQEFTTTLRTAVYYSKDSTFAAKTFVADTTVPATQTTYQYAISEDTVATGQSLYLRFYPYNRNADASYKLVDMMNVTVAGKTTGVAIQLPTVTTTAASNISTSFFSSGGTVSADGGGNVTARGVCWNTSSGATIQNSVTSNGAGTGSFTSQLSGLAAGQIYYVRAYATNAAGTGYGNEITVATLSSIGVPAVTTTAVSNIMAVSAKGGGNVTAWGGDTVTVRGVCWNSDTTTGYPTVTDSKTIDGANLGTFTSALSGLTQNTKYFVRAYATNSAGTGYGTVVIFTTQIKSPDTTVVVAQNGTGNYTTVGDAFRAVPANYTGTWTIVVKKGKYHEKDTLAAGKVNVVLLGEQRDSTVIWNDDYSDNPATGKPGTSGTFTVSLNADDFVAKNITFANTYWPNRYGTTANTQGVAVSANGDRQQFINCVFSGYQDTYYTRGSTATGRAYHKNCIFMGTVDYVFGRNICVFDSCTFMTIRSGGTITAGATDPASLYGYVFRNCSVLGDTVASTDSTGWIRSAFTASNGYYLGRPWQGGPRTAYIHCYESANLHAAGWTTMSVNPTLYTEYNCYGPGSVTRSVVFSATGQPSATTATQAAAYSLTKIFARASANSSLIVYDWMPSYAKPEDDLPFTITGVGGKRADALIPHELTLANYPNPFNPETKIQFTVAKPGHATIRVYNLLGQLVARVFDGMTQPGQIYAASFDGSVYASGVYYYMLESENTMITKRMVLLK